MLLANLGLCLFSELMECVDDSCHTIMKPILDQSCFLHRKGSYTILLLQFCFYISFYAHLVLNRLYIEEGFSKNISFPLTCLNINGEKSSFLFRGQIKQRNESFLTEWIEKDKQK